MQKPIITSLSNPLIKQARALRQKKARAESGLFLVEGIHHVGEAIEAGWKVESVLYAPELLTSEFANDLLARISSRFNYASGSAQRGPQPVSAQAMESLADKENPQGIIALVHQRQTSISSLQSLEVCIALVSPQDPGNVGTILRTMDAVEANALFLLDGGVELYHPTVIRSSMGTIFWKPVIQTSFQQFTEWAHAHGYQLVGTSAHGTVDYQTFRPAIPFALVLGNEQKGLSPEQTKACDVMISLPMRGRVSSLNLAVAAGILMYRYCEKM